jgi:3-phenylpropionate/cinnamic acid dioxygenase small subunit
MNEKLQAGIDLETRQAIEDFLYYEAELLDDRRFEAWVELFTDDVRYEMPMRVSRERTAPDIVENGKIFADTKDTLRIRVERLGTEFAWAEDPPSRTRHFVTNIRIAPGEREGEIRVRSNLLVYRNRGDSPQFNLLSGFRQDILRRVNGAWKIAQRRVVLDQSNIASHNLSMFF